ncbi:MAG: hypothetical protein WCS99_21990, partial [Limisphaerales bacterium]
AVGEGVPMELYVDTQQKLYGLRAQAGFVLEGDSKAVEYKLPEGLSFEVGLPPAKNASGQDNDGEAGSDSINDNSAAGSSVKIIRFYPDGFIGDKSPASVLLRQRPASDSAEGDALAIAQSATRLTYEIQTVQTH